MIQISDSCGFRLADYKELWIRKLSVTACFSQNRVKLFWYFVKSTSLSFLMQSSGCWLQAACGLFSYLLPGKQLLWRTCPPKAFHKKTPNVLGHLWREADRSQSTQYMTRTRVYNHRWSAGAAHADRKCSCLVFNAFANTKTCLEF